MKNNNFGIIVAFSVTLSICLMAPLASAGLIGHYTFDNPLDLGADSSGAGNHADAINNVGYTTEGIFGGAATFTASASSNLRWAGVSDAIANSLGNDFSFSVWVKTTQVFGSNTGDGFDGVSIVYSDIAGSANDAIPMALNGSKLGFFTGGSYYGNTIHSTTDINSGVYAHLAVTRDFTSGEKKLYVNGIEESSAIHVPGLALNERQELILGGKEFNNYFTGSLDDLLVYDSVLTPAEIADIYDEGFSAIPEPSTAIFGLVAALGGFVRRRYADAC